MLLYKQGKLQCCIQNYIVEMFENYYSALHIGIVIFQKECTKSGHTFLIEYRILWKIPLRNIAVGGLYVM
jgi:hypothetical protein